MVSFLMGTKYHSGDGSMILEKYFYFVSIEVNQV
jgi:hypothetical protein